MGVYLEGMEDLDGTGTHVWGTSGITVSLHTSSYTPAEGHTSADLTNELSGGNYATLSALTNQAVQVNAGAGRFEYLADKAVFPGLQAAAGTPKWLVIRDSGDDTLLFWVDCGVSPPAPDGNNYEVRFDGTDGQGVVAYQENSP